MPKLARLLSVERKKQIYRLVMRKPVRKGLQLAALDKRYLIRDRLGAHVDRELLARARGDRGVCWMEGDLEEPLVTVAIPTYNRPETIVRAVESAMTQSYERLDILIVGDATDAVTERLVTSLRDPRVRFVNLPHRGIYPQARRARWQAMGIKPMNAALDLAAGTWIANCDDDDELLPNHVEALLRQAKSRRLEFVHGKVEVVDESYEQGAAPLEIMGSDPLRHGEVTRGNVLYSMGLSFMRYDPHGWRINQVSDWNLWRQFIRAGVRIGFVDEIVYRHYVGERPQPAFVSDETRGP